MATEIGTRKFTADEYRRLVDLGILRADERLELIEGDIVEMAPIGDRHGLCVSLLTKPLVIGVGDRALVWVHGPVRVGAASVPEPDLALIRPRSYRAGGPAADDVLLVIEVADTSLRYDETVKAQLYARAAIPEYWIVGVDGEWVDVYRGPAGDRYGERRRARRGEGVAPLAFTDVTILVDDVFA